MQSIRPIRNSDFVKIIYGKNSLYLALSPCLIVDGYLEEVGSSLSEYALALEFENMQGMLVYFNTKEYREYVRENGYLNIGTLDSRSRPYVPSSNDADTEPEDSLYTFVQLRFMEGLDLPAATADKTKLNRLFRMMGISNSEEDVDND
jgi:hypothetical protein